MKAIITLAGAAAIAVSTFSIPTVSLAQSARSYGSGDVCAAQRRSTAVSRRSAVQHLQGVRCRPARALRRHPRRPHGL